MILLDFAYAQQDAYLKTLEDLVDFESPTFHRAASNALANHLQGVLRSDGWQVKRLTQSEVGDQLIASWQAPGDTSTLILAHYDTVWPLGTLKDMPFRRNGDKVYGPGVCDMKAGITNSIHALRLVHTHALTLKGPVTLLLTSDEEAGSHHSRDVIEDLAKEHQRVLVVEPSRDDGAIKVGRKGVGEFRLYFKGKSAHAGNNPKDGASALRELAHFLFFAEELNDDVTTTSVNVTVAQAGTVSNVIAEEASVRVDVRVPTRSETERVTNAIYGYTPRDERVSVSVTGGVNRPPLEPTDQNRSLYQEAKAVLDRWGLDFGSAVVGGGSDGNFTSALGIPTLDGIGAAGGGPHARFEHIRLRETLERLALLTALITES
ncbi:MAG: M20 family metallopeptidase [Trueperaceae bacterium]|nr:MAG: M20 family metallopeptidase [Trueperaceae bacterium]